MKSLIPFLLAMSSCVAHGAAPEALSSDALKAKVIQITDAQNKMMMRGSTVADIDKLFELYTDDFVYVHEAYGGIYTREELYANSVKALERGSYNLSGARYRIVATIPGHNGIAVERLETKPDRTASHLTVFEFRGARVSKIIEYWK